MSLNCFAGSSKAAMATVTCSFECACGVKASGLNVGACLGHECRPLLPRGLLNVYK